MSERRDPTRDPSRAAVEHARALRREGRTLYTAASEAAGKMTPAALREVAERWIVGRLIEEERAEARQIEARAANPPRPAELFLGKYRHGSTNKRTGAIERGCECPTCTRVLEAEERANSRYLDRVSSLIRSFSDELRMEWTEELLSSSFAVGDGTTTTWRDATTQQHQERVDMLSRQAGATIETAARHQKAIDTLRSAGADTLGALVESAGP